MAYARASRAHFGAAFALGAALVLLASVVPPTSASSAAPAPTVLTGFPVYAQFTPNDPFLNLQWGLVGTYGIKAPQAWDATLGSHNVTIAVVDTGVWYTDSDIAPNMWNNTDGTHGCASFTSLGPSVLCNDENPMDADVPTYHGTGVAGVIGAVTNNGELIAGVCQCSIMALRALGSSGEGSSTNVSYAIRWAVDHGARIINLSLGTNTTINAPTDMSNAISYAWSKGALIIAAAGNEGTGTLDYPASLPNVVSVGAIAQNGLRAPFSNYGTGLSISAPGYNIYTLSANDQDQRLSGTSLATPFVSGVAGLIWSLDASLTNRQVWDILNRTADPVNGGYNTDYGWGIVDAFKAVTALNQPFIFVNGAPRSVSRSATFQVSWTVLGPAGLPVNDTHVIWGTDPGDLGNATPAQTGTTRENFTAGGLQIPSSAQSVYLEVVATVNGNNTTSPMFTVTVSNIPDFINVLLQLLQSNLLALALFILALAAVVAFVPRRQARRRRARQQVSSQYLTYPYAGPPPGAPPLGPPAGPSSPPPAPPPPVEFIRPGEGPPPTAPEAPIKRPCPRCGTLVNANSLFCFYCGQPLR